MLLFLSPAIARVVGLIFIGFLSTGCSKVIWTQSDPRLVRGDRAEAPDASKFPEQESSVKAWRKEKKASLDENIGEPFPDLTLIDSHGQVVRLSSFRGRRVALLAAIAPFATTNEWIDELAGENWQAPPGFDEIVVLVSHGGDRAWRKRIRDCPSAYLVGWPLEGFVAKWNAYPTMYAIDADGLFEGSWSFRHQPTIGGWQSNNPLNLSVTPLAYARVTPAG